MTILKDPVRPFDPAAQLEIRVPEPRPGDAVLAAMRPRASRGKTSFELASRGGYVRTVTGTIAFHDVQAEGLGTGS